MDLLICVWTTGATYPKETIAMIYTFGPIKILR